MNTAANYAFRAIGEDVTIHDPVTIIRPEAITLGSHVMLSEYVYLAGGQGTYLGSFIHLASHTAFSGGGLLIAEDFVGIASGTRIVTGTDHVMGQGIPSPMVPAEFRSYTRSYVILKKHVFLATNVVVQPGVVIGEGTVVGSGSVVTKDLEPWGVYMGSPARRVKDRPMGRIPELEAELMRKHPYQPADFSALIAQCRP